MTINKALVLMTAVRGRIGELSSLREKLSVKEYWHTTQEKEIIPQYNVQDVDKKVVELRRFLFNADSLIKESNAKTEINLSINVDDLLAPLEQAEEKVGSNVDYIANHYSQF